MKDKGPSVSLYPSQEDVVEAINGVANGNTVIIVGATVVAYDGRASSKATKAQRLLLVKPDGSMILHSSCNNRPVNWQPPGADISVDFIADGPLVVKGVRKKPNEILAVTFLEISLVAVVSLSEGKEGFDLEGSEGDMVRYVQQNPRIIAEGFVPMEREAKTDYGSADMIGRLANGSLLVLEFKRAKAQLSSVSQLERYVSYFRSKEEMVEGMVIAPDITKHARTLLNELGFRFCKLLPETHTTKKL
ncbi:MAG: endonuclease NucS [Nitrososphaerota archaeon]|nr:endonuclease NucS [Ferrimicrobium acidiphilum]MDG6933724.1 endonuclease NucS [Nitrososphaerota archaeon]